MRAVRRQRVWGVELELEIDSSCPLPDLTESVRATCDLVDQTQENTVLELILMPSLEASWWPGDVSVQDVSRWEQALRRVERLRAHTLAVAHGVCVGPTLDALLTVDVRVATPDLRLVVAPGQGQPWPGMALYRLANQLGVARARQAVLLGKEILVERAMELGLIDQITDDTSSTLAGLASALGHRSGVDLAIRRQLLLEAPATSFELALGVHLAACDRELRQARRGFAP